MTQQQPPKNVWQKGRKGPDHRLRTHQINVRFTPDEAALLQGKAAAQGVSLGALLRNALLSIPLPRRRPRPAADHKLLAQLIGDLATIKAELGKHGSNLNQLAYQANARRLPPTFASDLAAALEAMDEQNRTLLELRDGCMRAFGLERNNGHDEA